MDVSLQAETERSPGTLTWPPDGLHRSPAAGSYGRCPRQPQRSPGGHSTKMSTDGRSSAQACSTAWMTCSSNPSNGVVPLVPPSLSMPG